MMPDTLGRFSDRTTSGQALLRRHVAAFSERRQESIGVETNQRADHEEINGGWFEAFDNDGADSRIGSDLPVS